MSILSTAFTLIRRYPVDDDEHISRLLNEFTGGYFDDPIDMQRSLPATTLFTTLLNVNNNDSIVGFQTAQPPPPPPISQSLSINIISDPIETTISESPLPYLLYNDNDMTLLII